MRVIALLVIIGICGLFFACSPSRTKDSASASSSEKPTWQQGIITFCSGQVQRKDGENWLALSIGQALNQADVVKTGAKSSVEIQFGQTGIVHVAEQTTVVLQAITLKQSKQVDLELLEGAVTSKVNKLTGDDRYRVRTDLATCAVRGTKFSVTKHGKNALVAVETGTVAVVPTSFDQVSGNKEASTGASTNMSQQVAAQVILLSPQVRANSQLRISQASMAKAEHALTELLSAMQEQPLSTANAKADQNLPAPVERALQQYESACKTAPDLQPVKLGTQARLIFTETQNLQILPDVQALPAGSTSNTPPAEELNTNLVQIPRLPTAQLLSPTEGEHIDVNSNTSIQFRWSAVPGAKDYDVSLFQLVNGTNVELKKWTTADTSVTYDQFNQLVLGDWSWSVTAVPGDEDKRLEHSEKNIGSFSLTKSRTLEAPEFKRLAAPMPSFTNN